MAKSSYLDLCKKVARECGVTYTAAFTAVTGQSGVLQRICDYVADADVEVQSRWTDWDFLHVGNWSASTSVGVAAIAAPSNLGAWDEDSFFLDYSTASFQQLVPMDYSVWRGTLRNGVKTNGKPSFIVVKPDQSLILETPPDAVYSVTADYWKRPVKMTTGTDTSQVPEEYERVIVARAKMMYGEYEAANEIMAGSSIEYDDLLDKLEAKYLPSNRTRRMSVAQDMVVRPA